MITVPRHPQLPFGQKSVDWGSSRRGTTKLRGRMSDWGGISCKLTHVMLKYSAGGRRNVGSPRRRRYPPYPLYPSRKKTQAKKLCYAPSFPPPLHISALLSSGGGRGAGKTRGWRERGWEKKGIAKQERRTSLWFSCFVVVVVVVEWLGSLAWREIRFNVPSSTI